MRLLPLLALGLSLAAADWSPALQMKLKTVGDVIPSPDGRSVVWTQTQSVMDADKSEFLTHIFFANSDGSSRRQLTQGEKSANAPAWSRDGKYIFFASDRSGKRNLYRLPVVGGEAEKLTDWKGVLGAYRVSPDGKHVAFSAADEDKDLEKRRKEKLDFKVIGENPPRQALWVLALDTPGATPKNLHKGDFHVAAFDWSPDSSTIVFDRRISADPNDAYSADILEVAVSSGTTKVIAGTNRYEATPFYSPDGRYIAFERRQNRSSHDAERIALYTRASGDIRDLAATPNDNPAIDGWAPDSRSLYVSELKGTRSAILSLPIDGPAKATYQPSAGVFTQVRSNATGTHLGFPAQSFEKPVEAYVLPLGGSPVQVSAANTGLELPAIGKSEVLSWKGKDGLTIEGVLTYPNNYQPGTKVPLILNIHGGPSGVFSETYIGSSGLYPIATFAAKGYAVLRPNPRGSTAYGAAFRNKVDQDWGGLDYQDILAGVDLVISKGVANPAKMCVMGWSYGGYMTAWTVTQTSRFQCAVVGAGITNHISMYGTEDIPNTYEDYFGGPPWDKMDVYLKSSPMQYIQNVKTPTLVLHGENDPRVPTSQGHEFHRALKRRGVETKMIVYPRMPHGPTEPKFTQHIMEQNLGWADKFLAQ